MHVDVEYKRFYRENNLMMETVFENGKEIAVGHGCIILIEKKLAFYRKEVLPNGVDGITWSICMNSLNIIDNTSLEIACILPDDEATWSKYLFLNILSSHTRKKVLDKLGL